jgi:hypothetical protein
MPWVSILSDDEIEDLYGIPKFAEEDRRDFFALDQEDKKYVRRLRDAAARVNYVLQLGYFRDSQNFFSFSLQRVREDAWFVIRTHFPNEPFPKKACSRNQYYFTQYGKAATKGRMSNTEQGMSNRRNHKTGISFTSKFSFPFLSPDVARVSDRKESGQTATPRRKGSQNQQEAGTKSTAADRKHGG